jgi:hypothetical protein
VCSVASLGFALAALPVGVERGYITYQQGQRRALRALNSLLNSNAHHNGIFCHFIDIETGNTTGLGYENIASSIDTALMLAGAVVAGEYFGSDVSEASERLFLQADWNSFVDKKSGQVYMAWVPKDGNDMSGKGEFDRQSWDWYTDETILISLIGQSSPLTEHRLNSETMINWNRPVGRYNGGKPYIYSYTGTLFTYMFAHCFYDFTETGKGPLGVDWFENTRRAVIANRDYCRDHSDEFASYGYNRWGITSGAGPQDTYVVPGHPPRGAESDQGKHGTLHPYGAGMSVPFLPNDSIAALRCMKNLKVEGKPVWTPVENGGFGFWDGFNIDQQWVSDIVIGIAQGPMLLMIENAETGLIWDLMMSNQCIQDGLKRAGFECSSF